jgi:hypothetical protein
LILPSFLAKWFTGQGKRGTLGCSVTWYSIDPLQHLGSCENLDDT